MPELWSVHNGDSMRWLEGMEPETADAVITDPPYASGGIKAGERVANTAAKYCVARVAADGSWNRRRQPDFAGDGLDQRVWRKWCREWLRECHRVLKPGGYCLAFIDWRQLPALSDAFQLSGLVWRGVLSWDKTEAAHAPKPGYFRRQCEFVVWGTKGDVIARTKAEGGGLFPGSFTCPVMRDGKKRHQTQKPIDVMRWLVRCCPPGGLVVDPFVGSGTTGVASVIEGRQFAGCEMVPEYADIARERITGAIKRDVVRREQPDLFAAAPADREDYEQPMPAPRLW